MALKLMHNKEEWLREQEMRQLPDGTMLDTKRVVSLLEAVELLGSLRSHRCSQDRDLIQWDAPRALLRAGVAAAIERGT